MIIYMNEVFFKTVLYSCGMYYYVYYCLTAGILILTCIDIFIIIGAVFKTNAVHLC